MKFVRREILMQALNDENWYKNNDSFGENDFNYIIAHLGDTYYVKDGMVERDSHIVYNTPNKIFMKFREK